LVLPRLIRGSRYSLPGVTQSGVILYPKPAGITSHDVVARVRRELRERTEEKHKVGHAGTLDPFATGLLLVLVGRATKAQSSFMALPKTYVALARLGWSSTTGDPEGELVETGRTPESLAIPVGEQMQRPHAFSAVKVGGERLYKKARRGELVEAPPRRIEIYHADLRRHDADHAEFLIECSSGTYVRQLVADLGDAYCEKLERVAIGPFKLADADPERILPLDEALSLVPTADVAT
jgi:tRNA pseudouridine55 synthase